MKKTIVVLWSLLFILILSACALAAGDATVWQTYAVQFREKEEKRGDFADWPSDEKVALVRDLLEMGYLRATTSVQRLLTVEGSQENKGKLADQIMMDFIGGKDNLFVQHDGPYAVWWGSITDAILGPKSTWTNAEYVWYQQIMNLYSDPNPDVYSLADEHDLTALEASRIAQKAIEEAHALPEGTLDAYTSSAILTVSKASGEHKWMIAFTFYEYPGNIQPQLTSYNAIVDCEGNAQVN